MYFAIQLLRIRGDKVTTEEAKQVLLNSRPSKPRKAKDRQLQQAIDVAVSVMDTYNTLLKAVSVHIGDDQ